MKDKEKTKEQLINELVKLRQRTAELDKSETERKRVWGTMGNRNVNKDMGKR